MTDVWANFGNQIGLLGNQAAATEAEIIAITKRFAEPEIIEPDQEPEDDTGAELPDVREDTVPDDPA